MNPHVTVMYSDGSSAAAHPHGYVTHVQGSNAHVGSPVWKKSTVLPDGGCSAGELLSGRIWATRSDSTSHLGEHPTTQFFCVTNAKGNSALACPGLSWLTSGHSFPSPGPCRAPPPKRGRVRLHHFNFADVNGWDFKVRDRSCFISTSTPGEVVGQESQIPLAGTAQCDSLHIASLALSSAQD